MKAAVKFVPILVLAALMVFGVDALLAAPIAVIVAIIVARATDGIGFKDAQEAAMKSVSGILVALFILMFAYAMANTFMSTGVGASVIKLALDLGITAQTVAVVGLVTTGILSVATGTSWGTFAACAPIFLWLSYFVGGDDPQGAFVLTLCATAGGACFGDNIGLISDTTIVSSGIQGVQVVDRIRTQGVWSISCLILAGIVFFIVGLGMGLSTESVDPQAAFDKIDQNTLDFLKEEKPAAVDLLTQVQGGDIPYYMIIPLVLVIALAIMGLNTFVCIGSGIVSGYILGLFAETTEFSMTFLNDKGELELGGGLMDFLNDQVLAGFGDAGSWVVVMMMWVAAFGGIMGVMNAFDPLANLIVKISRSVRQLMFWNGCLCVIGNAILSDEMAQIVTIGPIIKDITNENVEGSDEAMYKLALRNATFGDAMGVFGSQLIPWHVYLSFYVGIAGGVFPIAKDVLGHDLTQSDFILHNYMAMIAVISLLLLTLTGADRFVPLFRLPREPEVVLKKKVKA